MQVLRPKSTELREDNTGEVYVHIPEVAVGSMAFSEQALEKPGYDKISMRYLA
jgi:hypothetical protein